jgi:predicted peptidase
MGCSLLLTTAESLPAQLPAIPPKLLPAQFLSPALQQRIGWLAYVPDSVRSDSTARWPLLVFLHGAYERGDGDRTLAKVLKHGPPRLIAAGRDFPFLVVTPQLPAALKAWPLPLIADVIAEARRRWPVDSTRIYLTGLSDGGDASWRYAMAHPEEIAAIVPIASEARPEGICRMRGVAVWAFHGEKDSDARLSYEERLVDAYNACLPAPAEPARLTVFPGATHNVWGPTYDGSAGFDVYGWLLTHHR